MVRCDWSSDVCSSDLPNRYQLLSTNGIQVNDIQHLDNDLESCLLEILDEKKDRKSVV